MCGYYIVYYVNFERNYDVLKSRSPCILLNKNINLDNKTESKMENPTKFLRDEPSTLAHARIAN